MFFRCWRMGRAVAAQILASHGQDQPPWQPAWNPDAHHEWEPVPVIEGYADRIGVVTYEADPEAPMNVLFGIEPRYSVECDNFQMPRRTAFPSASAYYLTFAHELIHATGAAHRLDRLRHVKPGKGVAREEIIATAGACLLLAYHRLTHQVPGSALSYIGAQVRRGELTRAELKDVMAEARRAVAFLQRSPPNRPPGYRMRAVL